MLTSRELKGGAVNTKKEADINHTAREGGRGRGGEGGRRGEGRGCE